MQNHKNTRVLMLIFRSAILYLSISILYAGFVLSPKHEPFWLLICALPAIAFLLNVFPGSPADTLIRKVVPAIDRVKPAPLYAAVFVFLVFAFFINLVGLGTAVLTYQILQSDGYIADMLIGISMSALYVLVSFGGLLWFAGILISKSPPPSLEAT